MYIITFLKGTWQSFSLSLSLTHTHTQMVFRSIDTAVITVEVFTDCGYTCWSEKRMTWVREGEVYLLKSHLSFALTQTCTYMNMCMLFQNWRKTKFCCSIENKNTFWKHFKCNPAKYGFHPTFKQILMSFASRISLKE